MEEIEKIDYESEFKEKTYYYNTLGLNMKTNLEKVLEQNKIDIMEIDYRVKTFDSFKEKIKRKEYKNPFKEMEDICGVRIICYYETDLNKIEEIIMKNFNVINKESKKDELEKDKFGYLSDHYIVTLKKEWLTLPILEGLEDYKAEVQVRTILMHAWAAISHKLNYKQSGTDVKFERKLNRLSGALETADDIFAQLKEEKTKKIELSINKVEKIYFNKYDKEYISEILTKYITDRKKDEEHEEKIIIFIEELKKYKIEPRDMIEFFKIIDFSDIEKVERIAFKIPEGITVENPERIANKSSKIGCARIILMIFNDSYYESTPYFINLRNNESFIKIRLKYKKLINIK